MSKKIPIYIVDAFTKVPFLGNPAAVCVTSTCEDVILTEEQMKQIAKEMNLSETAFPIPIKCGEGDKNNENKNVFNLRWFTPTTEVNLCGHATLATAHALFSITPSVLPVPSSNKIYFQTMSGELIVTRNEQDNSLQMDFPNNEPSNINLNDNTKLAILKSLGLDKDYSISNFINIALSTTTKKLILETDKIDLIHAIKSNSEDLLAIDFAPHEVRGLCVTTNASKIDSNSNKLSYDKFASKYDCVSRYFSPWNGIPEDPVTGSLHTVLGPYWAKVFNKNVITAYQASERGGTIVVKILDGSNRVELSGNAVVVLEGNINVV